MRLYFFVSILIFSVCGTNAWSKPSSTKLCLLNPVDFMSLKSFNNDIDVTEQEVNEFNNVLIEKGYAFSQKPSEKNRSLEIIYQESQHKPKNNNYLREFIKDMKVRVYLPSGEVVDKLTRRYITEMQDTEPLSVQYKHFDNAVFCSLLKKALNDLLPCEK